jgi:hypothetical protein
MRYVRLDCRNKNKKRAGTTKLTYRIRKAAGLHGEANAPYLREQLPHATLHIPQLTAERSGKTSMCYRNKCPSSTPIRRDPPDAGNEVSTFAICRSNADCRLHRRHHAGLIRNVELS